MPLTLTITPAMIDRVQRDWSDYAGDEAIRVEAIGGAIYGFGSELATLRILRKYEGKGRANYSENMKSFYFVLETSF